MEHTDIKDLSVELGKLLMNREMTIATAESCTAGGIGAAIAMIDGASRYYRGGAIVYATELKTKLLGVPPELIEQYGVVSEQTARAMNTGVLRTTEADMAISITGFAGSTLTPQPIWICVGTAAGKSASRCVLADGARAVNLQKATAAALAFAIELIKSE